VPEALFPLLLLGELGPLSRDLGDRLLATGAFMIVGRASDAGSAQRICRDRSPRAALLIARSQGDVALIAELMRENPLPVVVLAQTAALGVAALAAGAVEVLPATTPPEPLVQSLRLMGDLRVVGRRARPGKPARAPRCEAPAPEHGPGPQLVAIGASTGGPLALVELLSGLPAGFPAAVLVVQHMPDDYGPQFAAWLGGAIALEVRLAAAGDLAHPGTVYLADGGHDLLAGPGGFLHTRPRSTTGPCPSADVLFASVAGLSGFARCGVLLTGMGRDGAAGLLAIREAGGFTLVQDRASSVVSSMPDEALRLGAAELALPPAALASQLLLWAGGQRL